MSTILKRWGEPIVLVTLCLWGILSAFDGAGLSIFVSGPHSYEASYFIDLVYSGILAGVLISLFHARVAAVFMLIDALAAGAILLRSNCFGHGIEDLNTFLVDILIRPMLASLLLFALPAAGPLWRIFLERKRKSLN